MRSLTIFLLAATLVNAAVLSAQAPVEGNPARPESAGAKVAEPAGNPPAALPPGTPAAMPAPASASGVAASQALPAALPPAVPTQPATASSALPPAQTQVAVPAPSPAAPPTATRAETAALAAHVAALEQALLSQRDRELSLYRETNRLVTTFGVAFALIGLAALVIAAWLTYRGLIVGQRGAWPAPPGATGSGLVVPPPAAVPGIERVQASGQRFQNRMSSLEQRLSELEHMAGREVAVEAQLPVPSSGLSDRDDGAAHPHLVADAVPAEPAGFRRFVPRAAILVQKALTQISLGKPSDALATADEAVGFDASCIDAHLARGQVLEKLGRLPEALQAYESAIALDEENTNALLLKAGVLNRQERFADALACYERALEIHRTRS